MLFHPRFVHLPVCRIISSDCHQQNVEDGTYDVVDNYHRRNRAPRAPDADRLHAIRLIGRSGRRHDGTSADQSEAETDTQPSQRRKRAPRHSRKTYKASSDNPTKLGHYPTNWRKIMNRSQDYFRGWMVTECGYPDKDKPEHQDAARGKLHQALAEHQQKGGRVEEGSFHLLIRCERSPNHQKQGIFLNTRTT